MNRNIFNEVISKMKIKSFPNLDPVYSADVSNMLSEIKEKLIYICENDFFYFDNWNVLFKTTCVTWINWFWFDKWSFKTPTGLHYVSDMIWDWSDKYQKFVGRVPTEIVTPVNFLELKPWVYTRILRLEWVEKSNKNTLSRGIYIHWNIHDWYWDIWELKKSKWCIWLKVDEMVELFNLIKYFKKRVFVYIEEK